MYCPTSACGLHMRGDTRLNYISCHPKDFPLPMEISSKLWHYHEDLVE